MNDNELGNIPPLVPERDDVDSHHSKRRSQNQEIVRPVHRAPAVRISTWPVRFMLLVLTLLAAGGGYAGYYFWGLYQDNLRQADLRIGDLELRLALAGETAAESDNNLMENINQTIEQYDLLWANWRNNNQQFEDIQGEIARLRLVNEGQDEITAANSEAIASTDASLMANATRINALNNQLIDAAGAIGDLNASVDQLMTMRSDLESIREALSSGDSTVLGLIGRLEYMEESMESVNAHRLQINETLFRLQENVAELQRAAGPGSSP